MTLRTKKILFFLIGFALSVIPVTLATLSYFPLWLERGEGAAVSGFTLLLLLICVSPLWKMLKRIFSSPAVWSIWLIIFILFFTLSKIADEMTVISFIGFISNALAAIFFKLSRMAGDTNK